MSSTQPQIVLTGAGGQLGQLVGAALGAAVADPGLIALGTRKPETLVAKAAAGFKTVRLDFDAPETLDAAFAGAQTVILISGNAPVEVRKVQHRAVIAAAKQAGVRRIVFTSFTNPTPATPFPFAALDGVTEADLEASGLEYTILRNSQYAENLAGTLAQSQGSNTLASPGAKGKVAYITRADIAAVTAAVATQDGHANKTYELTGPEALDLYEIADVLSAVRGQTVTAVDAEPVAFGQVLQSIGVPAYVADALLGMYQAAGAGEYAAVSADVETILGRQPESMTSFVRRTA